MGEVTLLRTQDSTGIPPDIVRHELPGVGADVGILLLTCCSRNHTPSYDACHAPPLESPFSVQFPMLKQQKIYFLKHPRPQCSHGYPWLPWRHCCHHPQAPAPLLPNDSIVIHGSMGTSLQPPLLPNDSVVVYQWIIATLSFPMGGYPWLVIHGWLHRSLD